jgi:hypothetical protein
MARWLVAALVVGLAWIGMNNGACRAEESKSGVAIAARTGLAVERRGDQLWQSLLVTLKPSQPAASGQASEADVVVRVEGQEPRPTKLKAGGQTLAFAIPAVEASRPCTIAVERAGRVVASSVVTIAPARKFTVYLLPHSHVDIGYTHVQADVERRQWENIETAMDICQKTAAYPAGSRFKWNSEVLWAVESYLRKAPPEKQQRLIEAIRAGQVELDALYGNELTGLCRPEELLRLMQWGTMLGRRCGVPIESAMISDVPGYTWGTVSAMAQAGVKYFSIGPNWCDRIGRTMSTWEDKPFYWLGPDGKSKVLCWIPYRGYAMGFIEAGGYKLNERLLERLNQLVEKGYPYDIVQMRWAVGSDNGPPDATLPDVVKNWNAKYAYPKMIIATTTELFRAFEKQYAAKIPVVTGDFTPYWEDGAGSSARETALNRNAVERLSQAEALFAMLAPKHYPAERFMEAWRNAILYDEHTWGAYNSISEPDKPFVRDQWKVKQAFAVDADAQSRALLASATGGRTAESNAAAVDVFNTTAWPRTDLVVLAKEASAAGDVVTLANGEAVPSQRLASGELAFLAKDVPALAGRRYQLRPGKSTTAGNAKADATSLGNSAVRVTLDPVSGAIASLRATTVDAELCDNASGVGLNRYCYVRDHRVKEPQFAGPAKIAVQEAGPLVASLRVESDAPGCVKFSREIRVVEGLDRVDIANLIDKKAVREKEAVHLGFAFNVPNGTMRIDIPWAVFRPETDQMPGSCKESLSVGRWADVSNDQYGVTWATLDAPLVEVGGITADKIGSVTNPDLWRTKLPPSQTLYSWVMNNHWHTNYKADQSGPTVFRYAIQPHKQYDAIAAQRFGIGCSQPLVAMPGRGDAPNGQPLVQLDTQDVMIASVKPSNDGKAWIVRLFGAAGKPATASLRWGKITPKSVWTSNLAEDRGMAMNGSEVRVPAFGLVTLRAELP